ncbi:MAG: Ig-like domain-containing protein, partial [Lachnospiraceae bacterium]|nr:Ig-like domain-containing protein [Lachnospiraceae bacterium]
MNLIKKGKVISATLGLVAFFAMSGNAFQVKADTGSFFEPEQVVIGEQTTGSLDSEKNNYNYQVELSRSGVVHVSASTDASEISYYFYHPEDKYEVCEQKSQKQENASYNETSFDVYLSAGKYIFTVIQPERVEAEYSFVMTYEDSNETIAELYSDNNDTKEKATAVTVPTSNYVGFLSMDEEADYYEVSISQSGKLNLKINAAIPWINVDVLDYDGTRIVTYNPFWNESNKQLSTNYSLELLKGKYYVVIRKDASHYGKYSISMSNTGSGETIYESNINKTDDKKHALDLGLGVNRVGQLALNEKADYYKIQVNSNMPLKIKLTGNIAKIGIRIIDLNNINTFYDYPAGKNGKLDYYVITNPISEGTYYVEISKNSDYVGTYTLNIGKGVAVKSIKVKKSKIESEIGKSVNIGASVYPANASNKALVYTSDNKSVAKVSSNGKVTMLKPGVAVIYVKSAENSVIVKKCTVIVKPKKVELKKVQKASWITLIRFKCTYKVRKSDEGYQVMFSKDKKFK